MEGTSSEQQTLYLLLGDNSDYKQKLTKSELKEIPLANLKFFSTHNSFIQESQFGGLLTYNTIKEMIKLSQFMPICIELDISNLSLKSKPTESEKSTSNRSKKTSTMKQPHHKIFLDHMTQRAHTFTSILDEDMTVLDTIINDPIPVTRRRSSWWGSSGVRKSSVSKAYGFDKVKHFACYNKSYHDKIQELYSLEAVLTNIYILLDNLGEDANTFPIVLTIDATQIKKSNSKTDTTRINKEILAELHRIYDSVFNPKEGTKYYRKHSLLDLQTVKLDELMNSVLLRHTLDDGRLPHILKIKGASTEVKLDGTGTNTFPSYTDFLKKGNSDHTTVAFKKKQKKVLTRFYPSYFIWDKLMSLTKLSGKKDALTLYKKLKSSACMAVESSTSEISSFAFDSELDNSDMSTESTEVNCHVLRKPGIDGGKTVECESYLTLNSILAKMVFGQNNHNFVSPNYKDLSDNDPAILEKIKTEFTRMFSPLVSKTDGSDYSGFNTPTLRSQNNGSSTPMGFSTPVGFENETLQGVDKRKSRKKKKRKTTKRKPQTTRRKPQTTRRKRNSLKKKK